jgi:hypothetical protein
MKLKNPKITAQRVIAAIIFAPLIAFVLYWAWEANIVDHNEVSLSLPVEITTPRVPVGGTVGTIVRDFCNEGVDTRVVRHADGYINGVRAYAYNLPEVEFFNAAFGPGCQSKSVQPVVLPNYVTPGIYKFRNEIFWTPNDWAGEQSVETYSEFFEVVGPGGMNGTAAPAQD